MLVSYSTGIISFVAMTKQYKILECNLRHQVTRSFCVFDVPCFFSIEISMFFVLFFVVFFIFIIDLMLQDKHLIFMVELFQFQIVQWSEMRGDCSCCWYWWNCWTSLFKFCIISIHFDTWHWLVFLWTSWLMYLLYLYITKTVVPKNYKSPTNKIWHHNTNNKLKGTSYSITVIKI